jgi:hypothetical protein
MTLDASKVWSNGTRRMMRDKGHVSLLDDKFQYVPAVATDIRQTFERERARIARHKSVKARKLIDAGNAVIAQSPLLGGFGLSNGNALFL